MIKSDARGLSTRQQEMLRKRAIALVQEGRSQTEAARELAVSRSAVAKWVRTWRTQGQDALVSRTRGRPVGKGTLEDDDKKKILDALYRHTPDDFGLPEKLWSNQAIGGWMSSTGVPAVTAATISLWMRQWGFRGPRPEMKSTDEYDDEMSQYVVWRLVEFPKVKRLARKRGGRIFLFDERPLPAESLVSKRLAIMLCAVDGRGTLYFRVAHSPVTARKRTEFMERLALDIGRPVFLLLDSHPNHYNGAIGRWQRGFAGGITLVYLPTAGLRGLPAECWPFGVNDRVGTYDETKG